jgi:predicted dehydrogenase
MDVRIGVIGIGNMGTPHSNNLQKGEVPGAKLTAVADIDPKRLEWAQENLGESVARFDSAEAMMDSGEVDAVIIATPHYDHPPLTQLALEKGLHVLCEKPAGVYTKHVREMNEAAAKSDKVFAIMFNQRTEPAHRKVKELVESGEIGEIRRVNYIITTWLRTQHYYNSGGWRASWAGEGGGVLLNQCPHNLDLWQWICGMPERIRAFCEFGKYHDIEVEDDVTAFAQYPNGATGVFVTTTGEAPGTNRLEIVGDKGTLLLQDGKITLTKLNDSVTRIINEEMGFASGNPETVEVEVEPIEAAQHVLVIRRFVAAITGTGELVAGGEEGINSLSLSNAMLLSAWTDDWVDMPVDEDKFYGELEQRIKNSTYEKETVESETISLDGSY